MLWGVKRLLPWITLALVDVLLGFGNYHASDDVQPVAAGLLVAGFAFAFWRPGLVWLLVPLLWLSVPASSFIADLNNYHPGVAKAAPLYQTVIALIPAAAGGVAGAGARWVLRQSQA
jgi:hypothetical protein